MVKLISRVPPAAAVAPVPARSRTVRDAARYSAMSSPVASVIAPVLAPVFVVTRMLPGTKVIPVGSASVMTELSAGS